MAKLITDPLPSFFSTRPSRRPERVRVINGKRYRLSDPCEAPTKCYVCGEALTDEERRGGDGVCDNQECLDCLALDEAMRGEEWGE